MTRNHIPTKNIILYNHTVDKLRSFFKGKGFVEVHTQDRLSILAACEDPSTIATFNYGGKVWPLPQTGQMWLEYELLKNPGLPGVFCVSTSYRNEPNPVPGRHEVIFPMFEFEAKGGIDELRKMSAELCEYIGLDALPVYKSYDELAQYYNTDDLSHADEMRMQQDFSPVTFIEMFPQVSSPFWNMKQQGNYANKIDVILYGMETIGSAERSTSPTEMRKNFHTISGGGYAQKLYDIFGKERVEQELEDFLQFDFFPRYGGGIGLTRLMRALSLAKQKERVKQFA